MSLFRGTPVWGAARLAASAREPSGLGHGRPVITHQGDDDGFCPVVDGGRPTQHRTPPPVHAAGHQDTRTMSVTYQRTREMTIDELLLENRVVFLVGEINHVSAARLMMQMFHLEHQKRGTEIQFYINSPGARLTTRWRSTTRCSSFRALLRRTALVVRIRAVLCCWRLARRVGGLFCRTRR